MKIKPNLEDVKKLNKFKDKKCLKVILIIIFLYCIFTYELYKYRLLILFNRSSRSGVTMVSIYTFVWTLIMVFSIDIAITQILYSKLSNDDHYIGLPILHSFDKFYFIIHRFITHDLFCVVLLYFIIAPLFVMYKNIPIFFLYIWQTSYIVILLVLIFLILSDFKMMYYINDLNQSVSDPLHNDFFKKIENSIFNKCSAKLSYDIDSKSPNLKIIEYINGLWEKIALYFNKYNKLSKVQNLRYHFQTNKLIEISSSVILNFNNYKKDKDICDLYYIVYKYIAFLQNHITSPIYDEELFVDNTIQKYVDIMDNSLQDLNPSYLNEDNVIKTKYIFPFQFVNEKYFRNSHIWINLNCIFKNSSFINDSVNLSSFKYNNQSKLSPRRKFVSINIKQLILNEVNFLYSKFINDNNIFYYYMLNSLRNTFPKFFKGYINSVEFTNNISFMDKRFRKILCDFNNLSKSKYYKKYSVPYLSNRRGF